MGNSVPADADDRRAAQAVVCYRSDLLPPYDASFYKRAQSSLTQVAEVTVSPRDASTFEVRAGQFFRIVCVDGHQVGDLNLWNLHNLSERFFSGKTRQLHATHVSTGDRLWSSLPGMRPMVTITDDSLAWYGYDDDGGSVHDVIGTRCDPYTNYLLNQVDYHFCCHSNLTRALAAHKKLDPAVAERAGDYIEFFAEMDLLGALSACPGGNCGSTHSDDETPCYPLQVQIFNPAPGSLDDWQPGDANGYSGTHGL